LSRPNWIDRNRDGLLGAGHGRPAPAPSREPNREHGRDGIPPQWPLLAPSRSRPVRSKAASTPPGCEIQQVPAVAPDSVRKDSLVGQSGQMPVFADVRTEVADDGEEHAQCREPLPCADNAPIGSNRRTAARPASQTSMTRGFGRLPIQAPALRANRSRGSCSTVGIRATEWAGLQHTDRDNGLGGLLTRSPTAEIAAADHNRRDADEPQISPILAPGMRIWASVRAPTLTPT
jgi:hypothetical protein